MRTLARRDVCARVQHFGNYHWPVAHSLKSVFGARKVVAGIHPVRPSQALSTEFNNVDSVVTSVDGEIRPLDANAATGQSVTSAGHHQPDAFSHRSDGSRLILKRAVDLLFASIILVLTSPILVACAVAVVVTSRGPILFRQERIGAVRERRGPLGTWRLRPFIIYKFRSMYVGRNDEDHRKLTEAIITGDKETTRTLATTPGLLKLSEDPRITPVGAFLRRSSLDELPQLINVIKGEMSIVGPRPPLQYEVDHYLPWHMGRFNAKPGMTGLWQVMGRATLSFEEMVKLDIQYTQQQSLLLDLRIMLMTFRAVINGRGSA